MDDKGRFQCLASTQASSKSIDLEAVSGDISSNVTTDHWCAPEYIPRRSDTRHIASCEQGTPILLRHLYRYLKIIKKIHSLPSFKEISQCVRSVLISEAGGLKICIGVSHDFLITAIFNIYTCVYFNQESKLRELFEEHLQEGEVNSSVSTNFGYTNMDQTNLNEYDSEELNWSDDDVDDGITVSINCNPDQRPLKEDHPFIKQPWEINNQTWREVAVKSSTLNALAPSFEFRPNYNPYVNNVVYPPYEEVTFEYEEVDPYLMGSMYATPIPEPQLEVSAPISTPTFYSSSNVPFPDHFGYSPAIIAHLVPFNEVLPPPPPIMTSPVFEEIEETQLPAGQLYQSISSSGLITNYYLLAEYSTVMDLNTLAKDTIPLVPIGKEYYLEASAIIPIIDLVNRDSNTVTRDTTLTRSLNRIVPARRSHAIDIRPPTPECVVESIIGQKHENITEDKSDQETNEVLPINDNFDVVKMLNSLVGDNISLNYHTLQEKVTKRKKVHILLDLGTEKFVGFGKTLEEAEQAGANFALQYTKNQTIQSNLSTYMSSCNHISQLQFLLFQRNRKMHETINYQVDIGEDGREHYRVELAVSRQHFIGEASRVYEARENAACLALRVLFKRFCGGKQCAAAKLHKGEESSVLPLLYQKSKKLNLNVVFNIWPVMVNGQRKFQCECRIKSVTTKATGKSLAAAELQAIENMMNYMQLNVPKVTQYNGPPRRNVSYYNRPAHTSESKSPVSILSKFARDQKLGVPRFKELLTTKAVPGEIFIMEARLAGLAARAASSDRHEARKEAVNLLLEDFKERGFNN